MLWFKRAISENVPSCFGFFIRLALCKNMWTDEPCSSMQMYIYVNIHIYVHVYIYIYVYIYVYAQRSTRILVCVYIYTNTHTYTVWNFCSSEPTQRVASFGNNLFCQRILSSESHGGLPRSLFIGRRGAETK